MIVQNIGITILGGNTVRIEAADEFDFTFTPANDVLKKEFKDKYHYVGGLQCNYEEGSKQYNKLHKWLVGISESVLNY